MATQKGRVLAAGENIKEKQQKLKEEREAKRAMLDERHYVLLHQVAHSLGLEKQEVEDYMLDGTQIEQITKFLVPNGASRLLFYYQEPDESGKWSNVHFVALFLKDAELPLCFCYCRVPCGASWHEASAHYQTASVCHTRSRNAVARHVFDILATRRDGFNHSQQHQQGE